MPAGKPASHAGHAGHAACSVPCADPIDRESASSGPATNLREPDMLHYALVFFVIAIIAALFGFGGIAARASSIAQVLFFVFRIVAVVSLVLGLIRGSR